MKTELVAAFSQEILGNAPEWIMYAPAGRNNISAKVDGKPSRVTITVEDDAAKALQSDLESRKAKGGPQPFFDFHHDGREASAYPKEFQWRKDGVWARVKWTHAGIAATKADPENGIAASVPYFSPRCAIANGRIVGLMDASTGNAAGGLVSDPAFEKITPAALVAAFTPNPDNTMDPMKARMRKMLGIEDGVEIEDEELMSKLEASYAAMKKKPDMAPALAEMSASRATLESELATARQELEAARAEAAESFVSELVASHKIAPKAEKMKQSLKKLFLTNPAEARDFASELVASNPGAERITDEGNAKSAGEADKGSLRQAKASEILASKAAPTFEAAWESACALIP